MKRVENINDIKAEVVVGTAIREDFKDVSVKYSGSFKRDFEKDIFSANFTNKPHNKLDIQISRKSIYDTLPEMLFHKQFERKHGTETNNMVDYSKAVKAEEKEARRFFAPFDSALFFSKVNIEIEEQELLYSLEKKFLEQHLHHLYHITRKSESQADLQKVIKLIPYAQLIAGNYQYLEEVLTYVTNERVEITKTIEHNHQFNDNDEMNCLGNQSLGDDLICGNSFITEQPVYHITFGPVVKQNILDYFCGDKKDVLEMIYDLFIPADFIVRSKVVFKETQLFTLNDKNKNNFLGFSTII